MPATPSASASHWRCPKWDTGELVSEAGRQHPHPEDNIAVANDKPWSRALLALRQKRRARRTTSTTARAAPEEATHLTETGTITADPLFVRPGTDLLADFRLQPGSPASAGADLIYAPRPVLAGKFVLELGVRNHQLRPGETTSSSSTIIVDDGSAALFMAVATRTLNHIPCMMFSHE